MDQESWYLAQSYSICSVALSPGARWLLVAAVDGNVGVWRGDQLLLSQTAVWRDTVDTSGRFTDAAFSPCGALLALCTWRDGMMLYRCWRGAEPAPDNFRLVARLGAPERGAKKPPACHPSLAAFSPCSRLLAVSLGGKDVVHIMRCDAGRVGEVVAQAAAPGAVALASAGSGGLFVQDARGRYSVLAWPAPAPGEDASLAQAQAQAWARESERWLPLLGSDPPPPPAVAAAVLGWDVRCSALSACGSRLALLAGSALHIGWLSRDLRSAATWHSVYCIAQAVCWAAPPSAPSAALALAPAFALLASARGSLVRCAVLDVRPGGEVATAAVLSLRRQCACAAVTLAPAAPPSPGCCAAALGCACFAQGGVLVVLRRRDPGEPAPVERPEELLAAGQALVVSV